MKANGARVGFWERFEQFRDHRIRTPLIGSAIYSWLIAFAVAAVTALFCRSEFAEAYAAVRASLPAAMIAVVGFIITALSVLVSIGNAQVSSDRGADSARPRLSTTVGSYIQQERPDGWRRIIRQISGAAKLAGAIAILVAVEPFVRAIASRKLTAANIDLAWIIVFTSLITLMVLNMLRVIWLLERTTSPLPVPKG